MFYELSDAIIAEIKSFKREHYYCEDTWYSCPKHPEGCANDEMGEECQCGATDKNNRIDEIVKILIEVKNS